MPFEGSRCLVNRAQIDRDCYWPLQFIYCFRSIVLIFDTNSRQKPRMKWYSMHALHMRIRFSSNQIHCSSFASSLAYWKCALRWNLLLLLPKKNAPSWFEFLWIKNKFCPFQQIITLISPLSVQFRRLSDTEFHLTPNKRLFWIHINHIYSQTLIFLSFAGFFLYPFNWPRVGFLHVLSTNITCSNRI